MYHCYWLQGNALKLGIPYSTITYMVGENIGELGELTAICQCFTYRYFPYPNIFNRHLLLQLHI